MRLPTAADSRGEVIGLSELTAAAHSLRFDSDLEKPFLVGLFSDLLAI